MNKKVSSRWREVSLGLGAIVVSVTILWPGFHSRIAVFIWVLTLGVLILIDALIRPLPDSEVKSSPESVPQNDPNIQKQSVLKYLELTYNSRMHNENRSHQMFYVLSTIILGSFAANAYVSGQYAIPGGYVASFFVKLGFGLFSVLLAIAGLVVTYRLQNANDLHATMLNNMHRFLGLENLNVLPSGWDQYQLKKIYDIGLVGRKGIAARGDYSWWATYKWIYMILLIIAVVWVVGLLWHFPNPAYAQSSVQAWSATLQR